MDLNSRVDARVVTKFAREYSVKNVGGVMELILSTLSDDALYLYLVLSK